MIKIIKPLLYLVLLTSVLMFLSNHIIIVNAKGKSFSNISLDPENKVGLVLGTIKTLKNGKVNSYFQHRIEATYALYSTGKIEFVLVMEIMGILFLMNQLL